MVVRNKNYPYYGNYIRNLINILKSNFTSIYDIRTLRFCITFKTHYFGKNYNYFKIHNMYIQKTRYVEINSLIFN